MTEKTNRSLGEQLEQQTAEARRAFAAWRHAYIEQNPLPIKPPRLDLRGLGFEFWLYLTQAIFSIALAAMRTADAFYVIGYAVAENTVYASGESILSVLVVELGMVVLAAIWAQKRYKNNEARRRAKAEKDGVPFRSSKNVEINTLVIVVGLILMALISMAAGLHQSIRIIENIDQNFVRDLSYVLGIVIGVGITVIAVIGGDILGQQLAIVTATYRDREADYQAAVDAYQEDLVAAWKRSAEYRVATADVRAAAKNSAVQFSSYETELNQGNGAGFQRGQRPPKQTERVFQYMDQIYQTEQRVASFTEVVQVLNLSKSTASTIRNQWLSERGIAED